MVATRSQEPGLVVNLEELPPKGTPLSGSAKKRSSSSLDLHAHDARSRKKRKESMEETPIGGHCGDSKPPISIVSSSVSHSNIPKDGIEVRVINGYASKSPPKMEQENTIHTQSVEHTMELSMVKSPESPSKQPVASVRQSVSPSLNISEVQDAKKLSPTKPTASHKRFDSEELQEDHTLLADKDLDQGFETISPVGATMDTESGDEAPETVTVSNGLSQARAVARQTAKVTEIQKRKEKQKRRDRDARLNLQARAVKTSKRSALKLTPDTDTPVSPGTLIGSTNADSEARHKSPSKSRLPLFLPDEILNAEPVIRPPTPPPEKLIENASLVKKRQLLNSDSRPPKDIRRGSVTVRVLDPGPGVMPPKVSKQSKNMRERWLMGRRGPKGGMERRKQGGGFVRRV